MKIIYATSESYPFVIGGEDAYISYSLPREISKFENIDIRVIMPKCSKISPIFTGKFKKISSGTVELSWRKIDFELEAFQYNGIEYYFISNDYYFGGDKHFYESDYLERVAFFSKAVLEAMEMIKFTPDIIHCNNLNTSLIPLFLSLKREDEKYEKKYSGVKTLFTFESAKYLGLARKEGLTDVMGLPVEEYSKDEKLGFYDSISLLKAGVLYSDISVTSDSNYAKDIMKKETTGDLSGFFQYHKKKIRGIRNGISKEIFNPKTDEKIEKNYSCMTIEDRRSNKVKLQEELKLKVDENLPLLAIIGKLDEVSGMEFIKEQFDNILSEIVEVVIVGDGEERYQDFFDYYSRIFPDKVYSTGINYSDDTLIKKVLSSADILLLPSKDIYGTTIEMMGKKYGVFPINNNSENFSIDGEKYFNKIKETLKMYRSNSVEWWEILANGMRSRNDLRHPSKKYLELYEKLKK